jgi:hypothetical protein
MKFIFKHVLIIFLLNLITACNTKNTGSAPSITTDSPSTTTPDPVTPLTKEQELNQLIQEFKTTYTANFSFLTDFKPNAYLNPSGGTTVGVCEVYSDGSKQIHFNQDWWPTTNSLAKKILVFHELGHCYFNRGHDTRLYPDGHPYSIMNPVIDPVVSFFSANTAYYINELKNPVALNTVQYPITFSTTIDGLCFEN